MSDAIRVARARLAANTRHHPDSDHAELAAQLKAAKVEKYVLELVATAPPLTGEQRDRIASLLRGSGDAA